MSDLTELVADGRALRAWLESLPPDEVAGEREWMAFCPLARCLAANGVEKPRVLRYSACDVAGPCGDSGTPLSDALIRFVRLVDRTRTPLTARKCLQLLRRAEREAAE